jgi:hypothetical protein
MGGWLAYVHRDWHWPEQFGLPHAGLIGKAAGKVTLQEVEVGATS